MGGVAVLNPHDVLKHVDYNRMPLISPSPSTSKDSNPNPKTVSNSNRRKRSPQKKTNDLFKASSPRRSNVLRRSEHGPSLVMGKVTILKRGQALDNDEKKPETTKIVVFDNKIENETEMFDKEVNKKEKKTMYFDEENKIENETEMFDKVNKKEKNTVSFDKENKIEDEIEMFDKLNKEEKKKKEKKTELLDKNNNKEKKEKREKKTELVDKKNEKKRERERKSKEKKSLVLDRKIMKEERKDDLSIDMMLNRLGGRFYAGSGYVDSPSPRLVPLPSFLAGETKDAQASTHLRSLLKLGF